MKCGDILVGSYLLLQALFVFGWTFVDRSVSWPLVLAPTVIVSVIVAILVVIGLLISAFASKECEI